MLHHFVFIVVSLLFANFMHSLNPSSHPRHSHAVKWRSSTSLAAASKGGPVRHDQQYNLQGLRSLGALAASTLLLLSTRASATPISEFYVKGFSNIYGKFPLKSDEVVVGLITKAVVGLGLKEVTAKEESKKSRVVVSSIKEDADDSIRQNARLGWIVVAVLTPKYSADDAKSEGDAYKNKNYINVEGLSLSQVYQVLKSVKSQPFSIVFRDPDEFFSQLSAPLNATVPSSSTTVVPARLASGGAEQVLYVSRDLPAAVLAQLQNTTPETEPTSSPPSPSPSASSSSLPQACKGDVVEVRYRAGFQEVPPLRAGQRVFLSADATASAFGSGRVRAQQSGCLFFLLGAQKAGKAKYNTYTSDVTTSTNSQGRASTAALSAAESESAAADAAAELLGGGGLYRDWDLLLQGAVVGERRTIALPPALYSCSDLNDVSSTSAGDSSVETPEGGELGGSDNSKSNSDNGKGSSDNGKGNSDNSKGNSDNSSSSKSSRHLVLEVELVSINGATQNES